jgi:hypothetical protein
MSVPAATLLAQLFATAGNPLHPTATGFKTGHEPVHPSESGQCVAIDADKVRWYCHSCHQGGDLIKAVMPLKGVPREDAETYFRELTSETTASVQARGTRCHRPPRWCSWRSRPPRFSRPRLRDACALHGSATQVMLAGKHCFVTLCIERLFVQGVPGGALPV